MNAHARCNCTSSQRILNQSTSAAGYKHVNDLILLCASLPLPESKLSLYVVSGGDVGMILAEVWYEQNMFDVFWGNKEYMHIDLREGGYLGDLAVDVMIVLKATLKKIWTGIRLV